MIWVIGVWLQRRSIVDKAENTPRRFSDEQLHLIFDLAKGYGGTTIPSGD
jgi:hypothetical protein